MTDRRWHLALAGLALLAFGLHFEVINHSFTFDDHIAIEGNPNLDEPINLAAHFSSGFWGPEWEQRDAAWRPFTTLTFSWNRALHGPSPGGLFLTNVVIHSIATVLLALLAVAFGLSRGWAFAAAALFAVHPVHIEAIAPGVGRADLLMTAASFAALLLWERRRTSLALVFLALAMLSKEMGAMVALALVWREWTVDGLLPLRLPSSRRWLAPIALLSLWLLGRYLALGALGNAHPGYLENPLAYVGIGSRVLTAGSLYLHALELFAAPFTLIADYSYATLPPSSIGLFSLLGIVLMIGTIAATVQSGRVLPGLSIILALWIGPYLLVSHLGPTLPMIFAERVLYLPSAGLCLLVAFVGMRVRWQVPAAVVMIVWCGLLAWRSVDRLSVWENDRTLWFATAEQAPRGVKPLCNAARVYGGVGDYDKAFELAGRALEIAPLESFSNLCLAEIYIATGDAVNAAKHMAAGAKNQPDVENYRVLSCAFAAQFEPPQAVSKCEQAAKKHPRRTEAWMYLAIAHDHIGNKAAAEQAFNEAIERSTGGNAMLLFNFGSFLANNGRLDAAADVLRHAHALAPKNPIIEKRLRRIEADLIRRR